MTASWGSILLSYHLSCPWLPWNYHTTWSPEVACFLLPDHSQWFLVASLGYANKAEWIAVDLLSILLDGFWGCVSVMGLQSGNIVWRESLANLGRLGVLHSFPHKARTIRSDWMLVQLLGGGKGIAVSSRGGKSGSSPEQGQALTLMLGVWTDGRAFSSFSILFTIIIDFPRNLALDVAAHSVFFPENATDRGIWQAMVHRVAKSRKYLTEAT